MEKIEWKTVKGVGIACDKNARHRRKMEDSHVLEEDAIEKNTAFFAIFDGHGGRQCVDIVEKSFLPAFKENFSKHSGNLSETWKTTYTEVDEGVVKAKVMYAGATSITVFLDNRGKSPKVYAANAGDARAIMLRGSQVISMSYEHKGQDAAEAERVNKAGGFMLNGRVSGMLAVTRSFGDCSMKKFVISDPYLFESDVTPEDTHIVLACDGLWDVCNDEQAMQLVREAKDSGDAARNLVRYALTNGSTDNISVVVVELNKKKK